MDWGFTDVLDYNSQTYRVACFAMICHHCGQQYIEFFPNARQENLFIGMIHTFQHMGIPRYVLTDNMKCVVRHRDLSGGTSGLAERLRDLYAGPGLRDKALQATASLYQGKSGAIGSFCKRQFPG